MSETEDIKWNSVEIPMNSEVWEFVGRYEHDTPPWKTISTAIVYNEFVKSVKKMFPEKISELEQLRPLVYKILLGGKDLPDEYFNRLKKLNRWMYDL